MLYVVDLFVELGICFADAELAEIEYCTVLAASVLVVVRICLIGILHDAAGVVVGVVGGVAAGVVAGVVSKEIVDE